MRSGYAYTYWEPWEKPKRVRWYHIVKSVDPDVRGFPVTTFLCGGHSTRMHIAATIREMPARCYRLLELCPTCKTRQERIDSE